MKFNRKISRFFIFASAALLLVLLAQPAQATPPSFGSDPKAIPCGPIANNWSPAGQPGAGDDVFADLTSTSTKTAVYDATSNPR